jgi:hypothetical protein
LPPGRQEHPPGSELLLALVVLALWLVGIIMLTVVAVQVVATL